jgi:hypothetical protein
MRMLDAVRHFVEQRRMRRDVPAYAFIDNAIQGSVLHRDPVPYFITDDVLPKETIDAMLLHWPGREAFSAEVPGNYVCHLTSGSKFEHSEYWHAFWDGEGKALAAAMLDRFRPWIEKRYGVMLPVQPAMVTLMEADPGYPGHACHTHHYHDPCWIGTGLLYLDDSSGFPGTTLNKAVTRSIEEEASLAASTLRWAGDPRIVEHVTADFRRNRLFAMFDSAISYHSVKAAAANAQGRRRIFRVHLMAPDRYVERIYGVTKDEYQRLRKTPTNDPRVVGWLRRDIEELRAS